MRKTQNMFEMFSNAMLTPMIVLPNTGLSLAQTTLGKTGQMAEAAAGMAGPFAGYFKRFSQKVAERALQEARDSVEIAKQAIENGFNQDPDQNQKPSHQSDQLHWIPAEECKQDQNHLLALTLIDKGLAAAFLPLLIASDSLAAMMHVPLIRDSLTRTGKGFSELLDRFSTEGVIPEEVDADVNASVRWAYITMLQDGPMKAIGRDFRGLFGGFFALALGDPTWLHNGLLGYRDSIEYIFEKYLDGKITPTGDFPFDYKIGPQTQRSIQDFPEQFVVALASKDPVKIGTTFFKEIGPVSKIIPNWLETFYLNMKGFPPAVFASLFTVPGAQSYALCHLAIHQSQLTAQEKTEALAELRKAANPTVVTFQYYMPMLVPFNGTLADKAVQMDVNGKPIQDRSVARSVFMKTAIQKSQDANTALFSLRSIIWLYGDEALGRKMNEKETFYKFGPKVADRIKHEDPYPLANQEAASLTKKGPRTQAEVKQILVSMMRKRGLGFVANQLEQKGIKWDV